MCLYIHGHMANKCMYIHIHVYIYICINFSTIKFTMYSNSLLFDFNLIKAKQSHAKLSKANHSKAKLNKAKQN